MAGEEVRRRHAAAAFLAGAILAWSGGRSAPAAGPTTRPWTGYPLYAKASAHAPHYADRTIWPAWVEKTDFAKETWPKARVLVWAHAGKFERSADPADAANWLEVPTSAAAAAGEAPAASRRAAKPPDGHTDVVFPSSTKRYQVSGRKPFRARHVTVGSGARVRLRDGDIEGNLWVKAGGSYSRAKGIFGAADKDTFCRSDNEALQLIPNMLVHNKRKDKGTEWIGNWKTGDEVNLFAGRMIIAPGGTFLPTDRRLMRVARDAELVLLSGCTFHPRGNQYIKDDMLIQGKLLAGTPRRPLTEDCVLGLSFKARGKVERSGAHDAGLILAPQGEIAVHSADPKTARLVFKWHRRPTESGQFRDGEPKALAKVPHGINMVLAGTTRLNGVEFNDVVTGGIRMPDPTVRTRWRNVAFGAGNFAPPEELFVRSELTAQEKRRCASKARGRWNPAGGGARKAADR
jgi:hypothetical protein